MTAIFIDRIKKIYIYRRTLWDMTKRQLKAKYAGSMLGLWWAVITPLILTLSISFVFKKVFKIGISNYTSFILSGMLPWFFFSGTLQETTNSFIANISMLKQGIFPREFIPLSCVLANFLNFLIGLFALLPIFIILNIASIKLLFFLFPIILFNLIFIAGLGILFSCINIFFRDFFYFLNIAFLPWFWITPVFYSLDMVPLNLQWICKINPMTHYVASYQAVLSKAEIRFFSLIIIPLLISWISFTIGYFTFIKSESLLLKKI